MQYSLIAVSAPQPVSFFNLHNLDLLLHVRGMMDEREKRRFATNKQCSNNRFTLFDLTNTVCIIIKGSSVSRLLTFIIFIIILGFFSYVCCVSG